MKRVVWFVLVMIVGGLSVSLEAQAPPPFQLRPGFPCLPCFPRLCPATSRSNVPFSGICTVRVTDPPFCATPDDGLDDIDAIQAAIDFVAFPGAPDNCPFRASSRGGTVCFPPGTYNISRAIELGARSGVILLGASPGSILAADQQATGSTIDFRGTNDDAIRISRFDADAPQTPLHPCSNFQPLNQLQTLNVGIKNLRFVGNANSRDAIHASFAEFVRIENNTFIDPGRHAIFGEWFLVNTVQDNSFQRANRANLPDGDFIHLQSGGTPSDFFASNANRITGNRFFGAGSETAQVHISSCQGNFVTENTFEGRPPVHGFVYLDNPRRSPNNGGHKIVSNHFEGGKPGVSGWGAVVVSGRCADFRNDGECDISAGPVVSQSQDAIAFNNFIGTLDTSILVKNGARGTRILHNVTDFSAGGIEGAVAGGNPAAPPMIVVGNEASTLPPQYLHINEKTISKQQAGAVETITRNAVTGGLHTNAALVVEREGIIIPRFGGLSGDCLPGNCGPENIPKNFRDIGIQVITLPQGPPDCPAGEFYVAFPTAPRNRIEKDGNYAVWVNPTWLTQVAVTQKSTTGFCLAFSVAPAPGDRIDWLLIR